MEIYKDIDFNREIKLYYGYSSDESDDSSDKQSYYDFLFDEKSINSVLNKILLDNPELIDVKCIIIETGYTYGFVADKYLRKKSGACVIYPDEFGRFSYGNEKKNLNLIISNKELYELTKSICTGGQLVFNSNKSINLINHINKLNELNYCAMCIISNIRSLTWYKENDELILFVSIDTEAG